MTSGLPQHLSQVSPSIHGSAPPTRMFTGLYIIYPGSKLKQDPQLQRWFSELTTAPQQQQETNFSSYYQTLQEGCSVPAVSDNILLWLVFKLAQDKKFVINKST